ncbi:MAG: 2-amino-4-hydroxy-6-hydroxymethyldihydropteridine diphosphokinase [Chitinispirillaceae bacterium]|nr:2-amino-4-hydroxy-6-hydroxymethyldihydropteridine diphosphokinase [Chitinispirillaceae bacterium]
MPDVILCLGTNLGDRAAHMARMESALRALLHPPVSMSRLLETEPLGSSANGPWFFNRLMRGRYEATPKELLDSCQDIERRLGRTRPEKHAPRTADIDILLFGEVVVNEMRLHIPHPRLSERHFCLAGLVEIAPEWNVPGTGKTVRALWASMPGHIQLQGIRPVEADGKKP